MEKKTLGDADDAYHLLLLQGRHGCECDGVGFMNKVQAYNQLQMLPFVKTPPTKSRLLCRSIDRGRFEGTFEPTMEFFWSTQDLDYNRNREPRPLPAGVTSCG